MMRLRILSLLLATTFLTPIDLASGQEMASIEVGDFYFCDSSLPIGECTMTVTAGDTVVWEYPEGTAGHTVTECGDSCDFPTDSPIFDSGRMLASDTFSVSFDEPGTHLYYCEFHPVAMRATIVVQPQPTPIPTMTSTEAPTPSPTASPTQAPTPTAKPPPTMTATPTEEPTLSPIATESDNDDNSSSAMWFVLGGALGVLIAAAGGVFFLRRIA